MERAISHEQFVENYAQAPDVAPAIKPVGLTPSLFG